MRRPSHHNFVAATYERHRTLFDPLPISISGVSPFIKMSCLEHDPRGARQPSVSNKKNVTHVSHFVTSADGLAAMVAPCSAALSSQAPKPRPARRRRGA